MIAQNAGFDSTDILNKLRQKHASGGKYFGVDIVNDGICDTHETFVWEPSNIKQNAIVRACSFTRFTVMKLEPPSRNGDGDHCCMGLSQLAEFGGRGSLCDFVG